MVLAFRLTFVIYSLGLFHTLLIEQFRSLCVDGTAVIRTFIVVLKSVFPLFSYQHESISLNFADFTKAAGRAFMYKSFVITIIIAITIAIAITAVTIIIKIITAKLRFKPVMFIIVNCSNKFAWGLDTNFWVKLYQT